MIERYSFSIKQNGITVAGGSGLKKDVEREAAHYAMMYAQDGPVEVEIKKEEIPDVEVLS